MCFTTDPRNAHHGVAVISFESREALKIARAVPLVRRSRTRHRRSLNVASAVDGKEQFDKIVAALEGEVEKVP